MARTDRPRRTAAAPVYVVAGAVFVAATAGLGWQMATGNDPALGARKPELSVQAAVQPRPVIIRRIEETTVVTRVVERPRARESTGSATPQPLGASSAAPVEPAPATAPAPTSVAVRPAPAPVAAAPPPPPAPVTRSS
jgi:hypothetical protein